MNRYILLIFLTSWSSVVPLSLQCDTGIAYPDHVLSVTHTLMANADVALLKAYRAEDVNECMNECCTEKYGSCTVVSFKNNVSESNCLHFNCRPVMKCKYVSSKSTDSFSFSESPLSQSNVPSAKNASKSVPSTYTATASEILKSDDAKKEELGITKGAIATYSEDQFSTRNDNTTIKPRKGVEDFGDFSENVTRSGIKPRKGVILDDIGISSGMTSKVKPRKGVGPFVFETSSSSSSVKDLSTHITSFVMQNGNSYSSLPTNTYQHESVEDVVSALRVLFEDDTSAVDIKPTSRVDLSVESKPTVIVSSVFLSGTNIPIVYSTSEKTSSYLQSSLATSSAPASSERTPNLQTAFIQSTYSVHQPHMPPTRGPSMIEHSKLIFHEVTVDVNTQFPDSIESEKERKFKSSMHLVLSLVFGLLVLFVVIGVVAKRVYDGWMRRHYRRMDFLIDGMYNAYE